MLFGKLLINCKIYFIQIWSADYVIAIATAATKYAITNTKIYVLVVTLSTQENVKLTKQVKSGNKRINNQNKYKSSLKKIISKSMPKLF